MILFESIFRKYIANFSKQRVIFEPKFEALGHNSFG